MLERKQYDLLMYLIRKEGEGWWISCFPHYHFTGSPRPAAQFAGASENESVGHKTKCGIPCSRNISHFKTERAEVGSLMSVRPFGQYRSQAIGAKRG